MAYYKDVIRLTLLSYNNTEHTHTRAHTRPHRIAKAGTMGGWENEVCCMHGLQDTHTHTSFICCIVFIMDPY